MKFTPEEMAYEPPAEVDFSRGLVLRGLAEWKRYVTLKRGWVKLDPKLRKAFPTDALVNEALRKVIEIRKLDDRPSPRRKSA